jgi:hypothetical protein
MSSIRITLKGIIRISSLKSRNGIQKGIGQQNWLSFVSSMDLWILPITVILE